MKMEPIVSSETSAIRTQTPANYPKRNNLYSFIVILSDHIFCTYFVLLKHDVCKTETCENWKKIPERSRSVLGRFYCNFYALNDKCRQTLYL